MTDIYAPLKLIGKYPSGNSNAARVAVRTVPQSYSQKLNSNRVARAAPEVIRPQRSFWSEFEDHRASLPCNPEAFVHDMNFILSALG